MYIGAPKNWQMGLQKSASPVMAYSARLVRLTNVLLIPIAAVIPALTMALCIKYSERVAAKRAHINKSVLLEGL